MKKYYLIISCLSFVSTCWSQIPFYPSNPSGWLYGTVVAIDGNEILSSSAVSPMPSSPSSAVYLFQQSGSTLSQTNTFAPSNVTPTDGFGTSLSINNNFIAIGSPAHNATGSTYIYKKNGVQWEFIQQLFAPSPAADDYFGSAIIDGNYMFVSAVGNEAATQPANTNTGAVYVYTFSGTQWTVVQELSIPGTLGFGTQVKTDNNTLVITSLTPSSAKIFHTFTLINGSWTFQSSSPPFGSTLEIDFDFQLHNNRLYRITPHSSQMVEIVDYVSGTWAVESTVALPSSEQIYSSIVVDNDNLFLGSNSYILQVQRKFPVLFYRKVNDQWQYQYSLFGTGPADDDDNFGRALAMDGNGLVIGARTEGAVQSLGMAYYVNTQSLGVNEYDTKTMVLTPNPVIENFELSGYENQLEKVEIYSVAGKLLLSVNRPLSLINASQLSSGIYFCKVTDSNGSNQTIKFIKR